jgi:hypothetical protein
VLRGETSLETLLERVRETFAVESAVLLERESDVAPRSCAGRAGLGPPVERPEDGDVDMPVRDHMALALTGRVLPGVPLREVSREANRQGNRRGPLGGARGGAWLSACPGTLQV